MTQGTACQTLAKASSFTYSGNDRLLLKAGDTWTNETLTLVGESWHAGGAQITVTSYGVGARPLLDGTHTTDAAIQFQPTTFWRAGWAIDGIDIRDYRVVGVYAYTTSGYARGLTLRNMDITDIYGGGVTSNATPGYQNLPYVAVWAPHGVLTYKVSDIEFDNLSITGCGSPGNVIGYSNLYIHDSEFNTGRHGGMWVSLATGYEWGTGTVQDLTRSLQSRTALIERCAFNGNGTVGQDWGIAGLQVNGGVDVTIRDCDMSGNLDTASSPDGVGLDLEGATVNARVEDCTMTNNRGDGAFLFNNTWGVPGLVQSGATFINNTIANNGLKNQNSTCAFIRIAGTAPQNASTTLTGNTVSCGATQETFNELSGAGLTNSIAAITRFVNGGGNTVCP